MSEQKEHHPRYGWPWCLSPHYWQIPPWDERIAKGPYRVAVSCLRWMVRQPDVILASCGCLDRPLINDQSTDAAQRARAREVLGKIMGIHADGMEAVRRELAKVNPISVRRALFTAEGLDYLDRKIRLTSPPTV